MKKISIIFACVLLAAVIAFASGLFKGVRADDPEATINISLSRTEADLNAEVTLTLNYSCASNTGFIQWNLNYDSRKLQFLPSGDQSEADGIISEMLDFGRNEDSTSIVKTYKFKTVAVGEAVFTVSDILNYRLEPVPGKDDEIVTSANTATLNIVEKTKSSNCYLKFIEPSQGRLEPAFNKNTLDYTVHVGNEIEVCYMYTEVEDRTARSELSGNEFLKVGDNVRTITVTAEDGTVRRYTVNVIRAQAATAAPTNTPTPTPTPTNTPTPTPTEAATEKPTETGETTEPTETPEESETPEETESPEETETPEDTELPTGSPEETLNPTDTPAGFTEVPTDIPVDTSKPEEHTDSEGDVFIGTFGIFGEEFEVFNIKNYLERNYPERTIRDTVNFIAGGKILRGINAYEGKTVQFLICARKAGGEKGIYLVDTKERTVSRFMGGDRIFASYDVATDSKEDINLPSETDKPTSGVYKFKVSEALDRSLDFGTKNVLFSSACGTAVFVVPGMIAGIAAVAAEKRKKRESGIVEEEIETTGEEA
ncbi:MAG: cadherin-like beta sandwich domain-containing protein [Clostridia bacterium]|nr:cadherin-like beta sandwich domain-containing protein [Clostridia bacterium]